MDKGYLFGAHPSGDELLPNILVDGEQRKGRIERRGNDNKNVHVYRYVTEGTFDAYLWQTVENKQKFISQIMTSKSPARTCEDVDEVRHSFHISLQPLDEALVLGDLLGEIFQQIVLHLKLLALVGGLHNFEKPRRYFCGAGAGLRRDGGAR